MRKSLKSETIFSENFVRNLHKRMYHNVWSWAGEFRRTNKNVGIDKWQIPTALRTLYDDAQYWIKQGTYPADEIAIRFKHRIVSIHCFSNGNGRHSRLIADVIVEKLFKRPVFTWGASEMIGRSDTRSAYLKALKAADRGNYDLLLAFSRS